MLSSLTLSALAISALVSGSAQQEAQKILSTVQARQAERWDTVDNYTVVQSVSGQQSNIYYEKIEIDGQPTFRMVPIGEYAGAWAAENGKAFSAEDLRVAADTLERVSKDDRLTSQGKSPLPGMNQGEMLGGMMGNYAMLLRGAAKAEEQAAASGGGRNDAAATLQAMSEFARRARVMGTEKVEGREAFLLRAEGLSDIELTEPDADTKFTLNTMSIWIDTEHYVLLRTKMEGDMEKDGELKPLTIERLDQDYRHVGSLYEPHRRVMRISGMMEAMDPKDREKLEKAQAQMKEMDAKLAEMPAATRSMVEGQMKKARAQMAALAESGAFETVTEVVRIDVNQGPPRPPGS